MSPNEASARRHRRAPASVRVGYQWGNRAGVGTTGDVSEGGLFVACDDVAPAGTRIYLRLELPAQFGGDALQIIGLVKRAVMSEDETHQGMGVHFEVATTKAREQLRRFVRALLEDHQEAGEQAGDSARDSVLPARAPRTVTVPASDVGWQRATAGLFRWLLALVLVGVLAYFLVVVLGNLGSKP